MSKYTNPYFYGYALLPNGIKKLLQKSVPGVKVLGSAAHAGSTTIFGSLSKSSNSLSEAPTA